jgi:diguanylate cyclase (GGDEF)-like protein
MGQLTGVANRRKVEQQIERRVKKGLPFSVIYLDINDFKKVNDTMGHLFGDGLLGQFAGELRMAFRSTDLIGRWDGDEFIVFVGRTFSGGRVALRAHRTVGQRRVHAVGGGRIPRTDCLPPQSALPRASMAIARTSLFHRADPATYLNKARASDRR